jgi:hypothetical protein
MAKMKLPLLRSNLSRQGAKAVRKFSLHSVVIAAVASALGCASHTEHTSPNQEAALEIAAAALLTTPASPPRWEVWMLPGKHVQPFEPVTALGQAALRVQASSSVSILRQRFGEGLRGVGRLTFSWKVDVLPIEADLRDAQAEDAPVRIVLTFGGNRSLLSPRTQRLSELSRLLTGEELPYATLAYVWSSGEPLETVINNPRTDRIRKLVVETGDASLGSWQRHDRDVRADFIRAFGEVPGPLLAIALMTDTDNTSSRLQAWYGRLRLDAVAASHGATSAADEPAVNLKSGATLPR